MDGLLEKYKTASGEAQSEGSEGNQPQVHKSVITFLCSKLEMTN